MGRTTEVLEEEGLEEEAGTEVGVHVCRGSSGQGALGRRVVGIQDLFLFISSLGSHSKMDSRLFLSLEVTILCQRPFVLVLFPVCVTDLDEIVMVALPGVMLPLSHCSSPSGVSGVFWAKGFSAPVTGFSDDRNYCHGQ